MRRLPPSPYAPNRATPLRAWNPLDYLRLLGWALYFPQGLRWYAQTFLATHQSEYLLRRAYRDANYRHFTIILLSLGYLVYLPISIIVFSFLGDVFVFLLLLIPLLAVFVKSSEDKIASIVIYFVNISAIAFFIFASVDWRSDAQAAFQDQISISYLAVALGLLAGVFKNFRLAEGKFKLDTAYADYFVIGAITIAAIVNGVIDRNAQILVPFAFALIGYARLETVVLSYALGPVAGTHLQRMIALPVRGLKRRIDQKFDEDWAAAFREIETILPYSAQFIPLRNAAKTYVDRLGERELVERIAYWCSLDLYDWNIVLSQFANTLFGNWYTGDIKLIGRFRWRRASPLMRVRVSTPAQAACAAFWYLQQRRLEDALACFAKVRHLAHGEELHANARAMLAALALGDLNAVGRWRFPLPAAGEQSPAPRPHIRDDDPWRNRDISPETGARLLRPQVRAALEQLGQVAQDIGLVLESRSPYQRSTALNRAAGILNTLKDGLDDCPTPERPILREIAAKWLELALDQASAIGTVEVRERIASPYTVGAVVAPERLIGRRDIFARIQQIWDKPGRRDSLVIYGQRRIGKSSIVRNLKHFCQFSDETGLAVLNIQAVDWEQGLVDLCFQIGFELWRALPSAVPEPEFEDFEQRPLIALRGLLVKLNQEHPERRYILILDEYEELEHNLPPEAGGEFIRMLRGWTQNYPWLVVALVGLHTLQERSADYFAPIFSWRPIPVGLMDADAVADMLQIADDAFPLTYSPDAVRTVHELTGGQPLLVQLIGDTLVEHFNRRLLDPGPPPASMFEIDDLTQALTGNPHFEADSAVYFLGVWRQSAGAPPGQHAILRELALHTGGWGIPWSVPWKIEAPGLPETRLRAASGLGPEAFAAALDALKRHDIVAERDGYVRYTVELMRRWVAAGGPDER